MLESIRPHQVRSIVFIALLLFIAVSDFTGTLKISEEINAESQTWFPVASPNYIFYVEKGVYHCYNTAAKSDRTSASCTSLMTSAIKDCSNGGSIAMKAGVYTCDIFINKKLCLSGEGRAATIIHGTITLDPTFIFETPACQLTLIQNLRLDGQNNIEIGLKYESRVPSVPLITVRDVDIENYTKRGVSFMNASDCLLENVVVGNCPIGIFYTTSHNFGRIKSCELLNYREAGVYTDAQIYLSDTVFSGMQIVPEKSDLVLDNACGTIIGCWFENDKGSPYAPCIDMASVSYRPLTVMSCFFANRGGAIIRVRSACDVLISGSFFSQQNKSEKGWCIETLQGQVHWNSNEIDSAFSATLARLSEE